MTENIARNAPPANDNATVCGRCREDITAHALAREKAADERERIREKWMDDGRSVVPWPLERLPPELTGPAQSCPVAFSVLEVALLRNSDALNAVLLDACESPWMMAVAGGLLERSRAELCTPVLQPLVGDKLDPCEALALFRAARLAVIQLRDVGHKTCTACEAVVRAVVALRSSARKAAKPADDWPSDDAELRAWLEALRSEANRFGDAFEPRFDGFVRTMEQARASSRAVAIAITGTARDPFRAFLTHGNDQLSDVLNAQKKKGGPTPRDRSLIPKLGDEIASTALQRIADSDDQRASGW